MLTRSQKGAVAESAIAHVAIKLGVGVYRPITEGGRHDLIFELPSSLVRVQCKTAVKRGDVVVVSCRSCRRTAAGFFRRSYTSIEIDAIAAHCAELDMCFYLPPPLFDRRSTVQLRLSPSRNNQKVGIKWASDFDLAATLMASMGP